MRIGILSDTHGHLRNTLRAIEIFKTEGIDVVIHCGDIGSPEIPSLFVDCVVHFVFGNVDRDETLLRTAITRHGHVCLERFGRLKLAGTRIAVLHGDDPRRMCETVASDNCDVVCYGHTHRAEMRWHGKRLLLNPGAVFRATPHSIATLELPQRKVEFHEF